jgi:hypothetical protein
MYARRRSPRTIGFIAFGSTRFALCSDSLMLQFHETPATDFGADPRTGMGELLGYLFDTDYTGAARVPLTKRYTLCARVAIVTD